MPTITPPSQDIFITSICTPFIQYVKKKKPVSSDSQFYITTAITTNTSRLRIPMTDLHGFVMKQNIAHRLLGQVQDAFRIL